MDNVPGHTYFTGLSYGNGRFAIGAPGPESLNSAAWTNWLGKHNVALSRKWLAMGEAFRPGDASVERAKVDLRAAIAERLREDDAIWHGWFQRHGGEVQLLGDHFGPGDAPSVLLVLAAMGLLWKMAQAAPRVTPVTRASAAAAAIPTSSRPRRKR
jgi:hypothetical protein